MPKRLASHLRALDSREEKFDELLSRWQEAHDTLFMKNAPGSAVGGVTLMPLTWNMSYRKLTVVMDYMEAIADEGSSGFRDVYQHTRQWYWRGEWRRGDVFTRDQQTGKKRKVEQMVFRPGPGADPVFVLRGLEWVSGYFPGEPYLPKEFLAAA